MLPKTNVFFNPLLHFLLAPLDRFRMPASRRIEFFGLFLAPPWILRGRQNQPKSPKWRQNCWKERTPVLPGRAPGADLFPGSILGPILDDFWMMFDGFLMLFWVNCLWSFVRSICKKLAKVLRTIKQQINVINRFFPQISIHRPAGIWQNFWGGGVTASGRILPLSPPGCGWRIH